MSKALVEIEGFEELQRKIKRLPDKVKRRELLKILGQVANPTLAAARDLAPVGTRKHTRYLKSGATVSYDPGNLKASIKKITARRSKVNAVLHVGAKASKKHPDGYYAHMVVNKGFKGKKRPTAVINDFLGEAYKRTRGRVTADAEEKVKKYIQKQIDRLSNV